MNDAASSHIFHIIIFYEPCKDSSSLINRNELSPAARVPVFRLPHGMASFSLCLNY